jgi:hypothetical protein
MSWEKKFGGPIRLKDGRELRTLSEARALILRLEHRITGVPYYEYAIELLLKAAQTRKKADVRDAEDQMHRALRADGFR